MKANKLTIEEQFLTSEQAKELQALGIDFSGGNFCYTGKGDLFIGVSKDFYPYPNEMINTLSVAEMIEMLPLDIETVSKKYGNQTVYLSIDRHSVMYFVSGIEFERRMYVYKSFEKSLLRDALFEMIKLLKQNKFI